MAVVGIAAVILGGIWFQMLVVFATAVMIWELWMMIEPERPTPGMLLGALAATVLSAVLSLGGFGVLSLLVLAVPIAGLAVITQERVTFGVFAVGIMAAGLGLVQFRADYGLVWLLWLVLVVVVTDIAGYFAGRMLGGPKFWPKISPKKTWSGTIAGWIGAGVVGLIFMLTTKAGFEIVPISMALSLAGQMGDIAESALKRRMGIKDSSDLIPGHGGPLDRFDALLGATLFILLIALITGVPGVSF